MCYSTAFDSKAGGVTMIASPLAQVRCCSGSFVRRAGSVVSLFLLACAFTGAAHATGTMTITCLDVGQGDATLIESPSGMTMLFDAGNNGKGNGVILPFLSSKGISSLDYLATSHYHSDHCGGMDEVFNGIPVNIAAYDRGWSYTTLTYSSYASAVSSKRQTLTAGQVIDLGEGVTVTCVALNSNGVLSAPFDNGSDENEYDVCLLVEYGGFDFFVAGDLVGGGIGSEDIESGVASLAGDVDVYQVNHHASATSSNAYFLQTVQAEVSVISVGSNSYGHPDQGVLDRLVSYGSYVYQTETGSGGTLPENDLTVVGGHVVITTDGVSEYTVAGDTWTIDEQSNSPVDDAPAAGLRLVGNYPNPFNPATEIVFESRLAGAGALRIYDLAGRSVVERHFDALEGMNRIRWGARDGRGRIVPGGMYLYTITTPAGTDRGRMLLLK